MILQLFLGLVIFAALLVFLLPSKHHRWWAVIMTLAVLFWGLRLGLLWDSTAESFTISWIPYKELASSFSLTNGQFPQILWILCGISVGMIYLNSFYRSERSPFTVNALIFLFIAAYLLLEGSEDFIQLMAGSCSYTILGFYMINNLEARQKFLYYNFIGEICLFTALAVVYSRLGTISLEAIPHFAKTGYHKDLVAVLILLAIMAKAGLFMFQNQLLDWTTLSFNRVIALSFVTTPLAAFLLYSKLLPLLTASPLSSPIFCLVLILSALWGFVGSLVADNIKAKALYWNLMFFSFGFLLLRQNLANLSVIAYLLPFAVLINLLMLMVNVSASNENYVSLMGGFIKKIYFSFILTLGGCWAFFAALSHSFSPANKYIFGIYTLLTVISLAHLWRNIYLGTENADDRVSAWLKNVSAWFWVPAVAGVAWVVWDQHLWRYIPSWVALGGMLLLILAGPLRWLNRFDNNQFVQDADLTEWIYQTFLISPLRLLGRILWLAVDFIVIERTIIGSISETTGLMVRGLMRVQRAVWVNYLMMVLIGLGIILAVMGYYYYE